jgi:hypothetical protein
MKPILNPNVREHHHPRLSATAFAEYLTATPDAQERVLHDCRYAIPPIVTANGDALRALRAYNQDPRRDQAALDRVKAALTAKARHLDTTPNRRDDALRCVEIIDAFVAAENVLGLRALACSEPGMRFQPLIIEGVEISIQPDLLIDRGTRIGAMMFRVAKSPDHLGCSKETTRLRRIEQRREMGRYLATMMEMLLDGGDRPIDRNFVFVADTRLPERITAAADFADRVRKIKASCRFIARLWPTIEPLGRVLKKT